jgi:peptidylprolyl isomerase
MRLLSRNSGFSTLAVVAVALAVSACGTSKAPGVVLAPSGGLTHLPITTAATTTTSTSTTTVSTPTSGPLSKEPKITIPTGPAPTKLVIKNLITGTGATAETGDQLSVNYVGELYSNGKVFDSSWSRHETFPFQLSNGTVIPGWVRGLVGMKVGGRRELIIPPSLAYGSKASGPIPANSTLVFVVDLLSVKK